MRAATDDNSVIAERDSSNEEIRIYIAGWQFRPLSRQEAQDLRDVLSLVLPRRLVE
jgi:hypothetical protein